jgi:hypothetical protein
MLPIINVGEFPRTYCDVCQIQIKRQATTEDNRYAAASRYKLLQLIVDVVCLVTLE